MMESSRQESKCSTCVHFQRNFSLERHFNSKGKHPNATREKLNGRARGAFAELIMQNKKPVDGFSGTCSFAIIGEALRASGIEKNIAAQIIVTDCEYYEPAEEGAR